MMQKKLEPKNIKYNRLEKIAITDAHSHLGRDAFWFNEGKIDEYIKNAKATGVVDCFLMSVPCPVISNNNGKKILSLHKLEGKEFKHYVVEESNGKKNFIPNLTGINPYKVANDYIYGITKNNSDIINFNYVPLIHPYYYSEEDIFEHIKRGAKMLKIHGIACGVIPKLIDDNFFKIIEYYGIPLLIHTDFSNEENLLSYNSAKEWLNVLMKYNIKVYFAHAARLDFDAISIINGDNRYIVGIGPDKLLSKNGQNNIDCKNFIDYCFNTFDNNKIVFDIDYPWNVKDIDNYELDWNSSKRIISQLSNNEQQKVLRKNIKKFIN